jgi:hypothetical protein
VHAGTPVNLGGPGHVWQVRTAGRRCTLHYRYWDGHVVSYADGPVPDCRLRPLPGIDETDELLFDTGGLNHQSCAARYGSLSADRIGLTPSWSDRAGAFFQA